ncbi:MAG TPA: type II toxin-antitoxin system prevent-host-death family antitoxin [Vicinamibacterales bacterium]|nr:type II toxin-antitoxin system prevent-host-death family antitoxin [Vicinamibacterales bacterium]
MNFRVAEARAQFGQLLDRAEQGDPVFIERHGVRFVLRAEPAEPTPSADRPFFSRVHAGILGGEWTWDHGPRGLRLRPSRTSRKRR